MYGKSLWDNDDTWDNSSWGSSWSTGWGKTIDWGSNFLGSFNDRKKINDFKKEIQDYAKENFIPINITNGYTDSSISKNRKLNININEGEFSIYKKNLKPKLDKLYSKIPFKSSDIWNQLGNTFIKEKSQINSELTDGKDITSEVIKYFEGEITHEELFKHFNQSELEKFFIKKQKEKQLEINADGKMSGYGNIGHVSELKDFNLVKKFNKLIKSKIVVRDITDKEESFNRGKRINRNYINGLSYKPLINKSIINKKKKKLYFIVDCSGSMGTCNGIYEPSYKAVSFLYSIYHSGLFDIQYIYFHSSGGYGNVIKEFIKKPFSCYGGGEGFEDIDYNLHPHELNGIDYVITLTDLLIDTPAQEGLYNFLKRGPKHLILSFQNKGNLNGMNVRTISKPEDMIHSLTTLLGRD